MDPSSVVPLPRVLTPEMAGVAEPRTLSELFERHADDVARWAQRLGGPGIDVEDVVQDVFLVAQRKWGGFRGDSRPGTWLFRITHHLVRARRRRRIFAWLPLGSFGGSALGETEPEDPPDPTPGADERLARGESDAEVHRALSRLHDRYRTVLVLFELEGLSGQQIAELLEMKVEGVWLCLHRARKAFAREFAKLTAEEAP